MATRSAIGYRKLDGSVRACYCHWDGHPEHQLPILKKHYNGIRKVQALIKPGSMSALRTRSTWEDSPLIQDANGYTRDPEGYLMHVNDRDPQPLYHVERCGMGPDYAEAPVTSHWPRNEWFHSHDCEYVYIFEPDKTWTVLSSRDSFDD